MANSLTDLDDRDPNLRISATMQADVQDWLQAKGWQGKPLLLVQAGNRRTMRTGLHRRMSTNTKWWPEDNWAAIIRMLAERHPDAVILLEYKFCMTKKHLKKYEVLYKKLK